MKLLIKCFRRNSEHVTGRTTPFNLPMVEPGLVPGLLHVRCEPRLLVLIVTLFGQYASRAKCQHQRPLKSTLFVDKILCDVGYGRYM